MFTGLIEATGRVQRIEHHAAGARLSIESPLSGSLTPGDSIAVNGVCVTVTAGEAGVFRADLSPETLRVTSLGGLSGRVVNLERPLRADARLGGHFVLGHVDATGSIRGLSHEGDFHRLAVEVPLPLVPYVVLKGSIALDGISLTVASLESGQVGAQIIPFTYAHTALHEARVGDAINIEVDVLGKYVARLLGQGRGEALVAEPVGRP